MTAWIVAVRPRYYMGSSEQLEPLYLTFSRACTVDAWEVRGHTNCMHFILQT